MKRGDHYPQMPIEWGSDAQGAARYQAVLGDTRAQRDQAREWASGYETLRRTKLEKRFEQQLSEHAADSALVRSKEQKRFEHVLSERAAEAASDRLRLQKEIEQDLSSSAKYFDTLADLARTGIDRARTGAERVQIASTSIATIYTGILGLAYAADKTRPVPAVGILPTIFLGLAIVCSTAYSSYITRTSNITLGPMPASTASAMQTRAVSLVTAANAIAYNRVYWLRSSVVSLSVAVLCLPAAFLIGDRASGAYIAIAAGAGLVVSFAVPLLLRGRR